jgi:hypothetical protein
MGNNFQVVVPSSSKCQFFRARRSRLTCKHGSPGMLHTDAATFAVQLVIHYDDQGPMSEYFG